MKFVAILSLLALCLVGCSGNGGAVDVQSVQQQSDKEKTINEKAAKDKPLPPGDGPSM